MERNIRLNWNLLVEEAIKRRKERKISQRRLAAIAEVSQPTVSRFEQRKDDIQLSSAIKYSVFWDWLRRNNACLRRLKSREISSTERLFCLRIS